MAERLGEALLDLDTRDKKFNTGVDRAERKARRLGVSLDLTAAKAAKMGAALGLAAAAGTVALGALVKKTIDHADAMSKAAARSGTTTEALSRLAWASDLSDVSIETLTNSFFRLSNAMADAASGKNKDLEAIFQGLGIAVTDADGRLRQADQVMLDLADVFARLENGAEKTALAMRIFGRSGAQLVPLLNNGRQGLAAMAAEADRLGVTISTDMGRRAEKFNDTMTRIKAVFQGMVIQIAGDLLPALQDFADKLADPAFRQQAHDMAKDVVAAFETIASAIKAVLSLLEAVGEAWGNLQGAVEWLNTHDMFGNPMEPDFKGFGGEITETGRGLKGDRLTPSAENRFDSAFGAASVNEGRTIPTRGSDPLPPSIGSLLRGAGGGSRSGATSEIERQKQAVQDLIQSLNDELAVLRTSDPAQQEMIRYRETLATATPEQTAEIERLIEATHREAEALAVAQEAFQAFGDMAVDALDGLLDGSKSAEDALADLAKSLQRMMLQAVLLGQGPLGGLFGNPASTANNGMGGLLGSLFSGFFATGGLIPSGTFGIVGERGPEPVIGTSRGAMVLPNSTLRNMERGGPAGGFNFQQTITPPDGFETRTREEDTPGGKRQDVYFEEAVANSLSRRGEAQSAVRNIGRLTRR